MEEQTTTEQLKESREPTTEQLQEIQESMINKPQEIAQSQVNQVKDVTFSTGPHSTIQPIILQDNIYLYYGSESINTFNKDDIKLSENTLFSFFSNNPRIASDNFMNCLKYPEKQGYIHRFIVKTPITDMKMISSTILNNKQTLVDINNKFCNSTENPKWNGIIYPILKKEKYNGLDAYDYIIGLCDPNRYLKYDGTRMCVAKATMIPDYMNLFDYRSEY